MSANKTAIAPATQDVLKALDLILLIDHSGSTSNPSTRFPGKNRLQEMEESIQNAANVMAQYDDDGLTVISFASSVKVSDGVTADTVRSLMAEIHPGGATMLGAALKEAMAKAKSSTKEVVILVYTDGEATDPEEVTKVINAAGSEMGRPKVGVCIIQVGNDPGATKFLNMLDNDLKVDILASIPSEDADNLSIEQLINAARTE